MSAPVLGGELGHPPGALRRRASELLTRPPYREEPEGPLARAVGAVRAWLVRLVDGVLGTVADDAALGWLVVAAGLVALLLVVWRGTRGLSLDRAVSAGPSGSGDGRPAAAWEAWADEHEAAGRWAEAVRCRYVALATSLSEAGIVEPGPGRTVGELDRELATGAPGLAPAVREAGEVYAGIVYGRRTARREHAARLRTLDDVVRQRLRLGTARAAGAGNHAPVGGGT